MYLRSELRQGRSLSKRCGITVCIGLLSMTLGWLTPNLGGQFPGRANFWLALVPIAAPVLLLIVIRPVFLGMIVLGFSFVNPSSQPTLMELGKLSMRYVDVAFAMLISLVFMRMAMQRPVQVSREFRELFAPLLPFLFYIAASVAMLYLFNPKLFEAAAASYLRLLTTAAFALVLHLVLRDRLDINIFHAALITFAAMTVIIGGWQAWFGAESAEAEGLVGRHGGVIGVNSLGLVSGLLVLYAILQEGKKPNAIQWVAAVALGLLGLFLAKSASSTFAIAGAVMVYITAVRYRKSSLAPFVKRAAIGIGMISAAAVAVWTLRYSDVSGLFEVSGGSFAQRLMIANAGLRIFLEHPMVGVGWQASATEAVIGSPTLNAALMERFPELPAHYFFDENPMSLHNMYIQFVGELGMIGFALFAYSCWRVSKAAARITRKIPAESPYKMWAHFYTFGLILLLIWWNTNPLFGGQIESVLACTFLGALATVGQLERNRLG
jgi:O-antigen ligase